MTAVVEKAKQVVMAWPVKFIIVSTLVRMLIVGVISLIIGYGIMPANGEPPWQPEMASEKAGAEEEIEEEVVESNHALDGCTILAGVDCLACILICAIDPSGIACISCWTACGVTPI